MPPDEPPALSEAETLDTTKVADRWRMSLVEGAREALDAMDEEYEVGDTILFERRGDSIYIEIVELGTTEIATNWRISLIKDVREEFEEMGHDVEVGDRIVYERDGEGIRISPG